MAHTTSHILMIRPAAFGFNPETAASNSFQTQKAMAGDFQETAVKEFDSFVEKLRAAGVDVTVEPDTETPVKPDAIFPNNWISTHTTSIVTYPMEADVRQKERRPDIVERLQKKFGFKNIIRFESYERSQKYLEGTGSIVFDHKHRYAFACLSSRTHPEPLDDFCKQLGYKPITFTATFQDHPIYHTNVMLSIGEKFAVVCSESIADLKERELVMTTLKNIRPHVIDVTAQQMQHFACNILEIQAKSGEAILAMSQTAFESFEPLQIATLDELAKIVASPIPTIENIGGGSARCMIAEIFA